MKKPLVTNSADEEQLEAAKGKEKRNADRELDDFRQVLNLLAGRRFIWRLMGECGVFRSSFTGSSETFFREGERNVGLKLLAVINEHYPEHYLAMVQESRDQP